MSTFDNPLDRRGNGSKKWDKDYIQRRFKTSREDIYPLFIADMDFRQDAAVLQALFGAGAPSLDAVFDQLAANVERAFATGVLQGLIQ